MYTCLDESDVTELTRGGCLNVLTHPPSKWKDLNGRMWGTGAVAQHFCHHWVKLIFIAITPICNYVIV